MSDARTIAAELARATSGTPWHGPSLATLLGDVTADEANARPVAGAHSMWELVLHMTAWTGEVARRLGGSRPSLPPEGDWPPVPAPATPEAWDAARRALAAANEALLASLAAGPPARLAEQVGDTSDPELGSGLTHAEMLYGLAQHHAYHGGQVALLRRAVRGR